jgi:hypothetical protein
MKKNFRLTIFLTWLPLTGLPLLLTGQTTAGRRPEVAVAAGTYETGQPAKAAARLQRGEEQPSNGPLHLRAGTPALCDSLVRYAPNGERLFKIAYEYDAAGRQILSVRYRPLNGALTPSDKEEYVFDAAGHQTLLITCVWENGAWLPYHKNECTYDAAGHMTVSENFWWEDGAWARIERFEYAFDAAGNRTLVARYYPEADGTWAGIHKITYDEYDDDGHYAVAAYYRWENGQWMKHTEERDIRNPLHAEIRLRTSVYYNAAGNIAGRKIIVEIQDLHWFQFDRPEEELEFTVDHDADNRLTLAETTVLKDGRRVPFRRCVFAYGVSGERTDPAAADSVMRFESSEWNGQEWINNERKRFRYDAGGREIAGELYRWDASRDDWVGDYKTERTFDAGGRVTFSEESRWNISTADWEGAYKSEYKYDAHGRQLFWKLYTWNPSVGDWIKHREFADGYDADGHLSFSGRYSWDDLTGKQTNGQETVYEERNENGDPVRYKTQSLDTATGRWSDENHTVLYYSAAGDPPPSATEPSSVDATALLCYVSGGRLHIRTAQATQVAIYTAGGVPVYAGRVQAGVTTLSTGSLPKGVLIVRSSDGRTEKVIVNAP